MQTSPRTALPAREVLLFGIFRLTSPETSLNIRIPLLPNERMEMTKKDNRQRLMLTVPPELYALLERLSKLAGASMSGLCVELLQDATPALEAMATALEQAREKNMDAFDTLARLLSEAQVKAGEVQLDMLDTRQKMRRAPTQKEPGNENGQE